jgi:hypothetical protein
MTVLGSLLAILAGLLRDLFPSPQLVVSPSGLTAPDDRRAPDDPPRLGAAGEVLACGVPAPARSRRGGPVQAQSTIGRPGGRPLLLTAGRKPR